MGTINELSKLIIMLIRAGAVCRVSLIFFQMIINEDEAQAGKKRVKFTIKFYIVAELVFVLKSLIMSYY